MRWLSFLPAIVSLLACSARLGGPEQLIVRDALTAIDACYHWGGEVGDQSDERNKQIAEGIARDCPVAHEKARRAYERYPRSAALAAGLLELIDIGYLAATDAEKGKICETAASQFSASFLSTKSEDPLFRAECPAQAVNVYGRAIVTPAALTAQQPAFYSRSPHDTLRYREVATSDSWLSPPGDSLHLGTVHDATIALSFGSHDSARAWYEDLAVEAIGPSARKSPNTAAALGQPFILRVDAQGRTETLSAPSFPVSFEGVSDLSHEFDDLFLVLPEMPLRPGDAWADTIERADSSDGRTVRSRRITRFSALRDTVVWVRVDTGFVQLAAVVIAARGHVSVQTSESHANSVFRTGGALEGDTGSRYLFATAEGRMLAKREFVTMRGSVTELGGDSTIMVPRSYRSSVYVTVIEPGRAVPVPHRVAREGGAGDAGRGVGATLDTRVVSVVQSGDIRVIEFQEGWEEVWHRVTVEWEETDEERHDIVVRHSVDLHALAPDWSSLGDPSIVRRGGRVLLTVRAAAGPMRPFNAKLVFELLGPGDIRLLPPKE